MIPENIIRAMRMQKAISGKSFEKDGLHFTIDFKVIESTFPVFMNEMVQQSLGEVDRSLYDEGYIAYTVLKDGRLQWKPTRKLQTRML